jgi:putative hydrolase of HD superfamily
MDVKTTRERLIEAVQLKEVARAGWVRVGVAQPESVAAHSWGVAWLVMVLCPDGLDRGRALEIALVHDLPEVRAGDITPHDGVSAEEKAGLERDGLRGIVDGLPRASVVTERWLEYERAQSAEARFVKACDKLDMALQAARYAAQGEDTREFVDSALKKLPEGLLRDLAGAALT